MSRPNSPCPHCGAAMRIRKSEPVSATSREGVLECTSADCGWRGKYVTSITHTLSPSLEPRRGVSIPLSPGVAARLAELAAPAALEQPA